MEDSPLNPDSGPASTLGLGRKNQRRASAVLMVAAVLLVLVAIIAWFGRSSESTTPGGRLLEGDSKTANSFVPSRSKDRPALIGPQKQASGFKRRLIQRTLSYGDGEGQIGMIRNPDQTPVGPESFALGPNGDILVADRVNHRIVVYASDGSFLRAIDLPDVNLNDVTADSQGRVFVYDQQRHTLHAVDGSGSVAAQLELDPEDIDTRGYFHVAGDSVYFADAAARDVLVATLKGGSLEPPDPAIERRSAGIHAETGVLYAVSVRRGEALELGVTDPQSQSVHYQVEISLPDILAARFVGEDRSGRAYVHVERLIESKVVLEVMTFGPAGESLGAIQLPENDYAIWTSKLLEAGADGTIVQFLPGEEQPRLNLLSEE